MGKLSAILLLACLILAQVGCSSARRGEPFTGPVDTSSMTLALGQKVFMEHCNQCHPEGEAGLGPALNNKPAPAFLIEFQVRHGLGAMPAFTTERISDDELNALTAYLIALRHQR